MFSQLKDRKHIEHNFHSVAGVMPQRWDLGELGGGVKNSSVGICHGAPSTAHSSCIFIISLQLSHCYNRDYTIHEERESDGKARGSVDNKGNSF